MNDHAADTRQVYANRRSQLRQLIDTLAGGNAAKFAEQTGHSRSRISQFLSENYNFGRSMGERAARAIEEEIGAPHGWLDQQAEIPADLTAAPADPLALILAELRKQTTLLEVLTKQGDEAMRSGESIVTTMSSAEALARTVDAYRTASASGLPG